MAQSPLAKYASGGGGDPFKDAAAKRKQKRAEAEMAKAVKRQSKKDDDDDRSVLGLGKNLIGDIGDAAMGFVPGMWDITKSAAHDAKDAVDGGGHDFKLDDMGKEMWEAVSWTYEPLAKGDFKEFAKRVYEHPLGPVLDAFTIVTLGAGGGVQAAKLGTAVGKVGSKSRLRGTTVVDAADGALDLATRRAVRASKDGSRIEIRAPRELAPKAVRKEAGDEIPPYKVGDYAENPIRRMQQRTYDRLTEAIPGWSERRIASDQRKASKRNAGRQSGRLQVDAMGRLVRSKAAGDPLVGRALFNAAADGRDAEFAREAAAPELERLEAELEAVDADGDGPEREARVLASTIGKADGPDAVEAVMDARAMLGEQRNVLAQRVAALDDRVTLEQADADAVNELLSKSEDEGWQLRGDDAELVELAPLVARLQGENDKPFVEGDWRDDQVERAADLKEDILERGFDSPIDVVMGAGGRLKLTDGTSRLIAAVQAGLTHVPVRLTVTDRAAARRSKAAPDNQAGAAQNVAVGRRETAAGTSHSYGFDMPGEWGLPVLTERIAPAGLPKTVAEARERMAARIAKLEERDAILAKAGLDADDALRRAKQLVKMRERPEYRPILQNTIEVQRRLVELGLDPKQTKLVNALIAHSRKLEREGTTPLLEQGAAMTGRQGPRSREELGAEDDGTFLVPRTRDRSGGGNAAKQSAQTKRDPSKARRPDSSRFSDGFNERFGLDAARPENVTATFKAAQDYVRSMETVQAAMASMRLIEDPGAPLPKGYKRVPSGVAGKLYDDMRSFIDDEASVMFGDDSPVVAQMRDTIVTGLGQRFSAGPQMVPEKLYDAFMREMQPRKKVPVLDEVVGAWRLAVVSPLRPAFVVNNIVGQSFLLGIAHAGLKGFRSSLQHGEFAKHLRPHTGGVTGSGQSAMIRENSYLLRNDGTGRMAKAAMSGRSANEWLGRLSQAVTDDPYRRLAFSMEILPDARLLVKERRKRGAMSPEGGRYEMKHALDELLEDDVYLDRIERSVMDDLVDFDDLSPTEREVVRRVLPFWSWIKGSSKLTVKLALDRPLYANMLTRLGQVGAENMQEDAGGALPDYMRGLIGLDDGGADGKDGLAVTTAQFSPFVTPGDLAAWGGFLVGGPKEGQSPFNPDNPLAATNPVIKAAVAAFTGKDPFTGQEMSPAEVMVKSFPQISGVLNANGKDGIYGKSAANEVAKYLGAPIRQDVDVAKARDLQANPYRQVEGSGRAAFNKDGKRFIVGNDGRLYMDVGAAG